MFRYLLIYIFSLPVILHAQLSPDWLWSELIIPYKSKADKEFVISTSKNLWLEKGTGESSEFYEGVHGHSSLWFGDFLNKEEKRSFFNLAEINKIEFIDAAELITSWNPTLDSCVIFTYEPLIIEHRKRYTDCDRELDTTCWVHCPLSGYKAMLTASDFAPLHAHVINTFADALGGVVVHDTINRVVYFTCDSNEYLPQVPYYMLAYNLYYTLEKNGFYDMKCTNAMSEDEFEKISTKWDYTNKIADPNSPGKCIDAPIKYLIAPKSVLIYEKWIPDTLQLPYLTPANQFVNHDLCKAYIRYVRHVVSYGVLLETGKIAWCRTMEAEKKLPGQTDFPWNLYQECFKAERFARMRLSPSW